MNLQPDEFLLKYSHSLLKVPKHVPTSFVFLAFTESDPDGGDRLWHSDPADRARAVDAPGADDPKSFRNQIRAEIDSRGGGDVVDPVSLTRIIRAAPVLKLLTEEEWQTRAAGNLGALKPQERANLANADTELIVSSWRDFAILGILGRNGRLPLLEEFRVGANLRRMKWGHRGSFCSLRANRWFLAKRKGKLRRELHQGLEGRELVVDWDLVLFLVFLSRRGLRGLSARSVAGARSLGQFRGGGPGGIGLRLRFSPAWDPTPTARRGRGRISVVALGRIGCVRRLIRCGEERSGLTGLTLTEGSRNRWGRNRISLNRGVRGRFG